LFTADAVVLYFWKMRRVKYSNLELEKPVGWPTKMKAGQDILKKATKKAGTMHALRQLM
jgi:hypothetical protein